MKVIGYKVDDSFYYKIKKEYGNVSEFLRKAVKYYLENTVNEVNSHFKQIKDVDEHNLLRKALDSLPKHYNDFYDDLEKSKRNSD